MTPTNLAPAMELGELAVHTLPGPPVSVGPVTLVPLFTQGDGPEADLLEEGIARGHSVVTEIGENGMVNLLNVNHQGPHVLLLLDGEEVVGAKQNRVFNASFLVPPGASVQVPVSCVEHGRWSYKSAHFDSPSRTITTRARSSKLDRTSNSVIMRGRYDSDQRAVWHDVDRYLERTKTVSTTSAFADAAERRIAAIEDRIPEPAPGQTGVAVVHGEQLVSIEILGSPDLFRRSWKKIARGILAEIYERVPPPSDATASVSRVLSQLGAIPVARNTPPGCGETLHGKNGIAVGAVVRDGRVYHVLVGGSA
jgi:hypothetical protein